MRLKLRSDQENTGPRNAFGARAGYVSGPDQFVFGVQGLLGETFEVARFSPSIDIGFGDDVTTILFKADLRILQLSPPGSSGGFYAGLGPSIAIFSAKDEGSDTEVGLTLVGESRCPWATRTPTIWKPG